MGFLTVASEVGMFHSACLFEFGNTGRQEWRGFHPAQHRKPVGQGEIDRSNREPYINHYIRFSVTDDVLLVSMIRVEQAYASAEYILGVRDCVSFSADVVRQCRLTAPQVNMTPYGLITILRVYNKYLELDTLPYPWK
jgi:hypothetical protein